jgi:hypothetical protein
MIVSLLSEHFTDGYNNHLDDFVDLKIDGTWYRCKVRHLPDIEHLLSVHPICNGKINVRFDTGLCGQDALANDPRPACAHLFPCGAVEWPYGSQDAKLHLCWDPQAGNDGTRLFYGAFEIVEVQHDG